MECLNDDDCSAANHCTDADVCIADFATGVACSRNEMCAANSNGVSTCDDRAVGGSDLCVECLNDDDCASGVHCHGDVCRANGTAAIGEACGENLHCAVNAAGVGTCDDGINGTDVCVECLNDDDCGSGSHCSSEACRVDGTASVGDACGEFV